MVVRCGSSTLLEGPKIAPNILSSAHVYSCVDIGASLGKTARIYVMLGDDYTHWQLFPIVDLRDVKKYS